MKKRKLKKKVIVVLFVIVLLLAVGGYFLYSNYKEEQIKKKELEIKNKIKKIKSHYNEIVVINNDSKFYEKNNDKYNEVGTISKDEIINLDKINIDENTKYFKFGNYYIPYEKVTPSKEKVTKSDRYKHYIVFNENIKTKDNFSLYRNDKIIYKINKSIDVPIIKKYESGYYIEYFGELLFVKKEEVTNTYEKNNTTEVVASEIPVTCNHFIYLHGDTTCNEMICHSEDQIREEFNYLRENNYFTLTTTELREWMEGKIRLPEKSLLITIDDGSRAWNFIPLLEEYKINATLFLITGWYPKDKFASPYMELASHTHDLHTGGKCPGGQGSGLKCLPEKNLLDDLTLSRQVLDNTEAFCYPFYEFNDYSESILKKAGFKMAFIGGMKKVTPGINPYRIPRISFNNTTTLDEYINYVKP